jgi:hypothetical protein
MLKTYSLHNVILSGQITSAALDAELAAPASLGAFHDLCENEQWIRSIVNSSIAVPVVFMSTRAVSAMFAHVTAKREIWGSRTAIGYIAGNSTARGCLDAFRLGGSYDVYRTTGSEPSSTSFIYGGKTLILQVSITSVTNSFPLMIAGMSGGSSSNANSAFSASGTQGAMLDVYRSFQSPVLSVNSGGSSSNHGGRGICYYIKMDV